MSATLKIKEGDTRDWVMVLKENDTAVNLSGVKSVKMFTRAWEASTNTVNGTSATVTDAANGVITYTPVAADVAADGIYKLEVEVVFADDSIATFPTDGYNRLEIDEDLG